MNRTEVSVIGLGVMGSALANAFLRREHTTTVWNRTASRAKPFAERGANVVDTVDEAVSASPLVIVCVLDDTVTRDVLQAAAARLPARVVVNLTTGTPRQARELSTWATERGAEYLDGGIMAIPPMIGQEEAQIFYSGSSTAFENHRSTLEVLGGATYFGPDPGLAAVYDLALLSAMYGLFAGFVHSVALAQSAGVKATEFMALLLPWLDAMKAELPRAAEQVDSGKYGEDVVSPLAMQAAGFGHLVAAADDQGIRPDLLVPMRHLLDEAVAAGHGDHDIAALVEVLRT